MKNTVAFAMISAVCALGLHVGQAQACGMPDDYYHIDTDELFEQAESSIEAGDLEGAAEAYETVADGPMVNTEERVKATLHSAKLRRQLGQNEVSQERYQQAAAVVFGWLDNKLDDIAVTAKIASR